MLTDLDWLEVGETFPPPSESTRIERYKKNERLWRGEHTEILDGWDRLMQGDFQLHTVKLVLNWHKRLSTLWADLTLGKPPRFVAPSQESLIAAASDTAPSDDQKALEDLVRRNRLPRISYEVVIDSSRFGDGLYRVRKDDKGQSTIDGLPPKGWFPVVSSENLRDVKAHVITWQYEIPRYPGLMPRISHPAAPNTWGYSLQRSTMTILRAEVHLKGSIVNRAFVLEGNKLIEELDVGTLTKGTRKPVEQTEVEKFLVVPVSPMRTTDLFYGMDDYTDLESIIHEMEIRLSQNSRILDRHADPSMAGPESILDVDPRTGRAKVEAGKFFPVGEGEEQPSYITWDSNLKSSFEQVDKLTEMLYVVSETSPAAFGKLDTGLAQSGSAMKRLLMAPLLKAQRIQGELDPALVDVVGLAMELEGSKLDSPVRIEWKDGLPKDFVELANAEAVRIGAGLSSVRSSLRRLDDSTEAEVNQEMQLIDQDTERKMKQQTELQEALQEAVAPPSAMPGGDTAGGGKKATVVKPAPVKLVTPPVPGGGVKPNPPEKPPGPYSSPRT